MENLVDDNKMIFCLFICLFYSLVDHLYLAKYCSNRLLSLIYGLLQLLEGHVAGVGMHLARDS